MLILVWLLRLFCIFFIITKGGNGRWKLNNGAADGTAGDTEIAAAGSTGNAGADQHKKAAVVTKKHNKSKTPAAQISMVWGKEKRLYN